MMASLSPRTGFWLQDPTTFLVDDDDESSHDELTYVSEPMTPTSAEGAPSLRWLAWRRQRRHPDARVVHDGTWKIPVPGRSIHATRAPTAGPGVAVFAAARSPRHWLSRSHDATLGVQRGDRACIACGVAAARISFSLPLAPAPSYHTKPSDETVATPPGRI